MSLNERIASLLFKYLEGTLTDDESRELEDWKHQSAANQELFNSISDEDQLRNWLIDYHPEFRAGLESRIFSKIRQRIPELQKPTLRIRILKYAVAAAIVCCVAAGAYLWGRGGSEDRHTLAQAASANPQTPGREGAILTLADGTTIVLDSLDNGIVARQPGSNVLLMNGKLTYGAGNEAEEGRIAYNTIQTPRGRQFRLELPDGTGVWLNAGSSLRYPTRFSGAHRTVSVTGEAYFEVAPDKNKPFIVSYSFEPDGVPAGRIEVTGTRFNINAYPDEDGATTTLIDGGVRLIAESFSSKNSSVVLQPGEQGKIEDGRIAVSKVETDAAIAWKEGYFYFRDAGIKSVMRQLQRWYNIQVIYEGEVPQRSFRGKIQRDLNLSDVLAFLKEAEVHFRIEGNNLIVYP